MSEDTRALENALAAIETCVNTLMLARTVILDRLEDAPLSKPAADATMGDTSSDPECEHLKTKAVGTMGRSVEICRDCGAIFGDEA